MKRSREDIRLYALKKKQKTASDAWTSKAVNKTLP